ncbi:MAG: hypothetical protein RRY34_09595 [Victivallaceae bacterium]
MSNFWGSFFRRDGDAEKWTDGSRRVGINLHIRLCNTLFIQESV